MSEMIERVARVIASHTDDLSGAPLDWRSFKDAARAAIEAMREPTEQMLTAEEVHPSCHMCGGHLDGWHNMIDAALNSSDQ